MSGSHCWVIVAYYGYRDKYRHKLHYVVMLLTNWSLFNWFNRHFCSRFYSYTNSWSEITKRIIRIFVEEDRLSPVAP